MYNSEDIEIIINKEERGKNMISNIILIIIGFILLIKGADFLVDGASEIAKRFHIPEIVIRINNSSNRDINA